jgi:hypothetical protein
LWGEAVEVAQLEALFFQAGEAAVQVQLDGLQGAEVEVAVAAAAAAREVRVRWGVKVAQVAAREQAGPRAHAKEVEHAEAAEE